MVIFQKYILNYNDNGITNWTLIYTLILLFFMDENICSICNKEISKHSEEEWIKCLKNEDDTMLDKIRKHYDR